MPSVNGPLTAFPTDGCVADCREPLKGGDLQPLGRVQLQECPRLENSLEVGYEGVGSQ